MSGTTRNVLVIGGSRGIGAAIVRRFASEGAEVSFTYAGSEAAAAELAAATGATAIRSDARRAEELTAGVAGAGSLDVLVYNAGLLAIGDPLEMELAEVDRMIDVNIRGAYVAAVEAARAMNRGGSILLVGSVNADRVPMPGLAAYAMTKSALQGLARGLARDLGPRGITVNVIQPGPTDTDMNPADGPMAADMHALMATGRHGKAAEVAALAAFLAGEEARGITGAMHTVDGGFGA